MAYYSGQAASYQELLDILVASCIEQGWIWENGVLTKNGVFLGLVANETGLSKGIVATGYTSLNKANPSGITPRLGAASSTVSQAVFPISYYIFIFENEVYLKIKFNINHYFYLAFGKSLTDPLYPRLWISATSCKQSINTDYRGGYSTDASGGNNGNNIYQCPTPFGKYGTSNSYSYNSVILNNLDGEIWSSGASQAVSAAGLQPLYSRSPSGWSDETIFLPINIFIERLSNKKSLICQFENAKFIRINHYEPEQLIVLGNDKWMVFPFYKKNSENLGGTGISDDTGTFGWAIRYDGP